MLSVKQSNTVTLKPFMNIDLSPVLNDGADIIVKDIRARYDKSVDIDDKPLAALKPETIERKRKAGYKNPEKPLIARGKLSRNQLKQRATKQRQRAVVYISRSGANYRGKPADTIYGFHHEGEGNLPSRQPFGISDKARSDIVKIFNARIRRIVRNHGR